MHGRLETKLLLALLTASVVGLATASPAWTQETGEKETGARFLSRSEPGEIDPRKPILIQGRIMATDRDVPLGYTNIYIEGTGYGTMAMSDGRFWLRGVPPGTWTIRAGYISYEKGSYTLTLQPGDLVELDFWLEPRAWRLETITVRAERKLLNVAETGTTRRLSSDEIENLPLDNLVEMVALQPGVSLEDNEIHVRGARSDDTQFIVDGMGVKDPLAAGSYGVSFNQDLINEVEVLTGGFSAEYGQAVSGVVNVSTKEGGENFEGKLTYKTDEFAPEANNYNTDNVRMTLSGPNPVWKGLKTIGLNLPGEQYLIVSGSSELSDTYLPTESLGDLRSPVFTDDFWSPRAENSWSGLAKLTWKFDAVKKLNFTYSNQQSVNQGFFLAAEGFPRKFQNMLDDYNVFSSQNILSQLTWKHVLSEESFYEIVAGRQFIRQHINKNGDDEFTNYEGITEYGEVQGRVGETIFTTRAGAYVSGDDDRWHDHYTDVYTLKADYTWMAHGNNQLKTGLEYNYTDMQLIDLQNNLGNAPPGYLGDSQDLFAAHPQTMAAYLQDRISYKGLILNLGARLDGWAPGEEVDDVMDRPQDFIFIFDEMQDQYYEDTTSVFGRRWKARLSPRVGVSFPVSEKDKFFFNYGHFSQWPRYNYVYAQLETDFATDLQLIGNPNLDPKVTVQYEAGIQHEFENLWSGEITFYSNDIFDYAQSVGLADITIDPVDTPDPDDQVATTISPVRYFNADAARSVGVEIAVKKRTTNYLSGNFSLALQRTTGTNSSADATFLSAQLGQGNSEFEQERSIRNVPLVWDRPWEVSVNLDFTVGTRRTPNLFGWDMPKQWSANLLYRAWSGPRYTTKYLLDGSPQWSGDTYGNIGPYRSSLDLRLNKYFDLPNGNRFTVFFEGRNLFDHFNYRRMNPWTGDGYYRGNYDGDNASSREFNQWPVSVESVAYVEDNVDPSHRTDPRTILMGVSYKW